MRITPCLLTCQDNPSLKFRFDVENDFSIDRTLTVSSKWNESGFLVSQAAAFNPVEISLSGKIGYLVSGDTLLNDLNEALDMVSNRLSIVQGSVVGGLIGPQLKAVSGAINTAQKTVSAVDNLATKIMKEVQNANGYDRIQSIKEDLRSIYAMGMLVKVESFHEAVENVIIESFKINYEDKTDQAINVSLSLKENRFVKLKTANLDKANFAQNMCRADISASPKVESGQAAVGAKPGNPDNRTSMQRNFQDRGDAFNYGVM